MLIINEFLVIRVRHSTIYTFAYAAVQGIHELLDEKLVAAYLHGSAATGDFVPNKSDLDLVIVCQTSLSETEKEEVRAWFANSTPPLILKGIDCAILTQHEATKLSQHPHWETIIRGQRHAHRFEVVTPSTYDEYSLLDLAMTRERGLVLTGPSPAIIIAAPSRIWLLEDCTRNVRIWADRDVFYDPSSGVLTACRSWLYLDKGLLGTKSGAGVWARSQSSTYAPLIDAALAQRRGMTGQILRDSEVKAFCQHVLRYLEEALKDVGTEQ